MIYSNTVTQSNKLKTKANLYNDDGSWRAIQTLKKSAVIILINTNMTHTLFL